jgi:glucose-6-phosphate isomerase
LTGELDPASTALHVVSKSGSTAETVANALVLRDWLAESGVDPDDHTVVTTGAESALEDIVADPRDRFAFPASVPGRYSALSPTGLLAPAFAGVDVDAVLAGARRGVERSRRDAVRDSPAYALAALSHLLAADGKPIHVVMPYDERLERFADWQAQLLAESLGKRETRDGDVVEAGQTPLPAMGVTDQHSLLQLFVEGPRDKQYTVIETDGGGGAVADPADEAADDGDAGPRIPSNDVFPYLGGHSLAELRTAECDGTVASLVDADRPVTRIALDGITPSSMGELLVVTEVAVAVLCELAGVDPFDQPGVEAGKRATDGLLGREGYEGDTDTVKTVRDPLFVLE